MTMNQGMLLYLIVATAFCLPYCVALKGRFFGVLMVPAVVLSPIGPILILATIWNALDEAYIQVGLKKAPPGLRGREDQL